MKKIPLVQEHKRVALRNFRALSRTVSCTFEFNPTIPVDHTFVRRCNHDKSPFKLLPRDMVVLTSRIARTNYGIQRFV